MSKSPFYKVTVRRTGRDLTELIDAFTYEDCTEEDDILKISLKNKTIDLVDDSDLLPGVELSYVYGFIGERISPKRIARISTIETKYGASIDITVTATDAGYLMKKDSSNKVWKNVTASQIAERIAKNNGLTAQIEPTKKVYDNLPQGNRTDFEFLKYLTTIETDGSFRMFVKDNALVFAPLDLKKPSIRTFTYSGPEGTIIAFSPKSNQNTKTKGSIKTTVTGVDPLTGETKKSVADSSNTKGETRLGGNVFSFDAGSNLVKSAAKGATTTKETGNGQAVMGGPSSQEEMDNMANKEKKSGSLTDITASLEVPADPGFQADTIITIKGVAALHAGNWYVAKVVHQISKSGGYRMSMDLKKNATNKKTGETADGDVNKSTGPDAAQARKKQVFKYDANSKSTP